MYTYVYYVYFALPFDSAVRTSHRHPGEVADFTRRDAEDSIIILGLQVGLVFLIFFIFGFSLIPWQPWTFPKQKLAHVLKRGVIDRRSKFQPNRPSNFNVSE